MTDLNNYPWKKGVNYRKKPFAYKVGKGEQGVLICEPYKSEILPHWKFKTPAVALKSSRTIYKLFLKYLYINDFIGADMARKYLQMGFTRARRYTNYKGGLKYSKDSKSTLPKGTGEPEKAISAAIFYKKWKLAEKNKKYQEMKEKWQQKYG